MKIAYISDTVWPYFRGGKEKRLFDISTRLAADGNDVHVYTMKWWEGQRIIKENGVNLHAICNLYPIYSGPRRSIKQGILFGLSCLRLITEKWDVIDVDHMPYFPLFFTKLVCIIKRQPMIATWHEVWGKQYWQEYLGNLGGIAYAVEKLSMSLPDTIISVSDQTTNKLIKETGVENKIKSIPDGVDVEMIRKLKPSEDKSDIIFVGRLLTHKNVDVLIKSINIVKNKIPNIKCLIIGDGPEKENLMNLVSQLKLDKQVKFLGFVDSHEEVMSLIKATKVFVLPSSREGFGIVVIEANAGGIPVITVDIESNASKYLIKDGINGYVCKLEAKDMAEKIINTLSGSFDKKDCIDEVLKYDWSKIIGKIKEVYRR